MLFRSDFIYTSSLKRAEDTAKIISHCNQIPFYSYDGLAEMNLGKWEGLTWSQVRNIYSTDYNIWHKERRYTIPPEGESYQQLLERFLNTINLLELYHKNILIVTHSAVIMTLLSYLNNTPFEEMHENYKTKNTELIKLTSEQCEKLFSPLN